jgi:hypothetical protein
MPVRGPVEGAVAQREALGPIGAGHGVLEVADGVGDGPHLGRQVGVRPVVLGLDRAAGAVVGADGDNALGDEAADAHGPARSQQVVGALGAQTVGHGGDAVGVPHVPQVQLALEGGELVDDHLGLGLGHGAGDRVGIERVGHHRPGAQGPQGVGLGRRTSHSDHVVAGGGELGDEL